MTPLAAAPEFVQGEDNDCRGSRASMVFGKPYLLAVGNLQPRKNLLRLDRSLRSAAAHNAFLTTSCWSARAQYRSRRSAAIQRLSLSDRSRRSAM